MQTSTVRSSVTWFEPQEFIVILPQSGYPFEYLSLPLVDLIWPDGKASFRFPCRPGLDGQDEQWAKLTEAKPESLVHRIRFGKDDPLCAIQFCPQDNRHDLPGFGPLNVGRGIEATPAYWGHHWPLSRGYPTGWSISDRIHETPAHTSLYHTGLYHIDPGLEGPLRAQTAVMTDTLGETREMTSRTFCWLIGMTDVCDDELRRMAESYAKPPQIEANGATLTTGAYCARERRALCLRVNAGSKSVVLKIMPDGWCVNPVFELTDAPKELKRVTLAGQELDATRYAWDGQTLWIEASFRQPTVVQLDFEADR